MSGPDHHIAPERASPVRANAGLVESGPLGAVAGRRAVDDGRVDLFQIVVADAQPFGDALAKILDEHIRLGGELAHDLAALGVLEVERDAALVAIHALEVGVDALRQVGQHAADPAELPSMVAIQRLDLDDLGAQVSQHHGGHRPELPHRPVNNTYSGQRAG